jgi:hypothetical protein
MRHPRYIAAAAVALALGCLGAGCAGRGGPDYGREYRSISSVAVKLYGDLEPLRSSRLGLTASDSLLFTYSDEEIKDAIKRLKRLEGRISRLPEGRLGPAEASRATVILDWARGSRFAFTEVQSNRSDPLLYCWAAEEALRVLPARIEPPYDGELDAYRRRIRRVPLLFSNAERSLSNPAELHVRAAIERLDSLEAALPGIAASAERRYATPLETELASARGAIIAYRRYAAETLLPSAHGRLILGSENLSSILDYGELVDADPNMLVAEATKQIKRLAAEKAGLEKRFELEREGILPPRPALATAQTVPFAARIDSSLAALRRIAAPAGALGAASIPPVAVVFAAEPLFVAGSQRVSCMSIPPAGNADAAVVTPLATRPACRTSLALSPAAARLAVGELALALLPATALFSEPQRARCEAADTAAAVFSSTTYDEGWRYLALQEIAPELKKSDPELYALVLDAWIAEYARMAVVFSLHAGTMTSEGAAQYFAGETGCSAEEAAREVLTASVSPEIAYAGVSMILVDEMTRNVSYVFGYGKPQEELLKLLRQWRDLPLPLIVPRTRSD